MTLKNLLSVTGSGEFLRIGTADGRLWLYHGRTIHLYDKIPEDFQKRKVTNIYSTEERPESRYCHRLEAGLAIVIAGRENGTL